MSDSCMYLLVLIEEAGQLSPVPQRDTPNTTNCFIVLEQAISLAADVAVSAGSTQVHICLNTF